MAEPKQIDDGGPAFPRPPVKVQRDGKTYSEYVDGQEGMKLRDWFAGQVLAQLAPHIMFPQSVEDNLHAAGIKTEEFEAYAAHVAYGFADAMIAERSKRRG